MSNRLKTKYIQNSIVCPVDVHSLDKDDEDSMKEKFLSFNKQNKKNTIYNLKIQ